MTTPSTRTRIRFVTRLFLATVALCTTLGVRDVGAQTSTGELRRQASRSELETAARVAEQAAASSRDERVRERNLREATSIRDRLKNGDFRPGDRILIRVMQDSTLSDTFTVRLDRVLEVRSIPPISLAGVLDVELKGHLEKEIAKYIKSPTITVTPLVRVAILGAVGRPGFYQLPLDQSMSDVIMQTGGPTANADLQKVVTRRGTGGAVILDGKAMQEALRLSKTVGDVAIRDGDEITVAEKKTSTFNFGAVLQGAVVVAGLLFGVRAARRN